MPDSPVGVLDSPVGVLDSPVRVVELTSPLTRFAGRILVGLAYEVVLVEPPGGDPDRERDGFTFGHWHAGKKSVVLDPSTAVGRKNLARLISSADVVLDGRAPDAPPLEGRHDSCVHVRVTAFGCSGPRRDWAGTDLTVAALGGMLAQVGDPDGPPLLLPEGQAEQLAGVNAAIAALLGLRARRAGPAPTVDVSAQECVAAALEAGALTYLHEDRVAPRPGSVHPLVPHGLFEAADGHVGGGLGGSPRMWDNLLAWLVEEDAAGDLTDPRWRDPVERKRGQDHVFDVVARFIGKWPKEEFALAAQRRKLPWSAVNRPDELLCNPQLVERDFFVDVVSGGEVHRDLGFGFAFPEGEHLRRLEVAGVGADQRLLDAAPIDARRTPTHPSRARLPLDLPLDGVRVLDLTWVLAGPYGTRVLADHGADVIKVESLGRPDPTRFAPFMHLGRGDRDDPNTSGYFNDVNRNKRSITLDTRSPAGRAVLADLIAHSDVLVENFSSSVLDKMGFGYERLRKLRPDIVYVSMSGMGHTGPRRDWVSYADIVSAATGLTSLTGWAADDVVGVIYGHGDIVAGLQAATAILAALEHRDRTGRGQHVDLSQLEAMASHLGTSLLRSQVTDAIPAPIGNGHREMSPHGVFGCLGTDSWCALAVRDATDWAALCDTIGRPQWADDPRFRTADGRRTHEDEIATAIETWTARLPADLVAERLQAAGIPAGAVQNGRDLVDTDPQLRARGFYIPGDHPRVGRFLHEGAPIRVGAPVRVRRAAPLLGADTDDVLRDVLRYEPAHIDRLRADGVLS